MIDKDLGTNWPDAFDPSGFEFPDLTPWGLRRSGVLLAKALPDRRRSSRSLSGRSRVNTTLFTGPAR
jgi:hypothetical protein